jgi:hypothetical protein
MMKPASLRKALGDAMPELRNDPSKFQVHIDAGNIIATGTKAKSFRYQYAIELILMDFAGDSDALFFAVVEWLQVNQPDLMLNTDKRADAIAFEVDILTDDTCDISIKLQLTEDVDVTVTEGAPSFSHRPEKVPEWATDGYPGT